MFWYPPGRVWRPELIGPRTPVITLQSSHQTKNLSSLSQLDFSLQFTHLSYKGYRNMEHLLSAFAVINFNVSYFYFRHQTHSNQGFQWGNLPNNLSSSWNLLDGSNLCGFPGGNKSFAVPLYTVCILIVSLTGVLETSCWNPRWTSRHGNRWPPGLNVHTAELRSPFLRLFLLCLKLSSLR